MSVISAELCGSKVGGSPTLCQLPRLQATPLSERRAGFRVQAGAHKNHSPLDRRDILVSLTAGIGAFASLPLDANASSFLKEKGGKGVLADQEDALYQLRVEKETAAKEDLQKEVRETQMGKFCATPFGVDVVGITEVVALIGALVGGVAARQRKIEVEKLNESLRKINLSLRQQARAGIVYAPGLRYAPPADSDQEDTAIPPAQPSAFQGAADTTDLEDVSATQPIPIALASLDDEYLTADQKQCRDALRMGKNFLKERNGAAAMVRFEKALMLSKGMQDFIQERRAMRGLAASARLQGQFRMAISHLERVLEISSEINDHIGDADAFGTIADVYTELGEFEKAAEYYDKYIAQMNQDGPV